MSDIIHDVQENFESLLEVVEEKEGELQEAHKQVQEAERSSQSHVDCLQRRLEETSRGRQRSRCIDSRQLCFPSEVVAWIS